MLATGIYMGTLPGIQPVFGAVFLIILFLVVNRLYDFRRDFPVVLLILITGFVLIRIHNRLSHSLPATIEAITPIHSVITGSIIEDPFFPSDRSRFLLRTNRIKTATAIRSLDGIPVLVQFRKPAGAFLPGDEVSVRGTLSIVRFHKNFHILDYETFLRQRGIQSILSAGGKEDFKHHHSNTGGYVRKTLAILKQNMHKYFTDGRFGSGGNLLAGIILGERRAVDLSFMEASRNTGTAHIFAVSGLHIGIIGSLLYGMSILIGLYGFRRALFVITGLFLYGMMVGFRPSVMRAFIMVTVIIPGLSLERTSNIMNSLGVAGLLILIVTPESLFDVGFQLSFTVTFFIITLYPAIFPVLRRVNPWRFRWFDWLLGATAVSLSAQLAALPILAAHFGMIPVFGSVVNVFATLMVSLLIPIGIGAWALSLMPDILSFLQTGIELFLNGTLFILEQTIIRAAHLPFASIATGGIKPLAVLAILSLLYLTSRLKEDRIARKIWIFLFLILINAFVWAGISQKSGSLEMTFLDVGQGDSIFIKFPGSQTLLIDGGPQWDKSGAGTNVILPYLTKRGIRKLDAVLLSHPEADHLGGIIPVCKKIEIGQFLYSGKGKDKKLFNELMDILRSRNIPVNILGAGDSLVFPGGANGIILHPPENLVSSLSANNSSLVLLLNFHHLSSLFTGDIGKTGQRILLCWRDRLNAHVLKVPHHGSSDAEGAFFARIAPLLSIISVGKNNYGHPSAITLQSLKKAGSRVFRTDLNGAIRIVSDGTNTSIKTARESSRTAFSSQNRIEFPIFNCYD